MKERKGMTKQGIGRGVEDRAVTASVGREMFFRPMYL